MRRKILFAIVVVLALATVLFFAFRSEIRRFAYSPAGRDGWQQPERVIQALELKPGETVADIGAGGGYFVFRMARTVGPTGKVYAVDIDADMVRHVAEQAKRDGLSNIETVLAAPDDPKLPAAGVDLILLVNTYHHIGNRADYFRRVSATLRPQGRLAVIEFRAEGWLARWFGHATAAETIRSEMESAGYRLAQRHEFLPRQHFLVFSAK
jgi:cyclopropane fatty-acyl-phospholipid synthase-like methyltransferase